MIFVTLGTQHFQMNRIIDEIDKLIELGTLKASDVIIQRGSSKASKYAKSYKMMDEASFNDCLNHCNILITHGGTASIIKGLKAKKKVLVIPRRKIYKEHVDDHQVQIADLFREKHYVLVIKEIDDLKNAIEKIKSMYFSQFESRAELADYIVEKYLSN